MKSRWLIFLFLFFLFSLLTDQKPSEIKIPEIIISNPKPQPGDIVLIQIEGDSLEPQNLSGSFNLKPIVFFWHQNKLKTIVPIDLYLEPGQYILQIKDSTKNWSYEKEITVIAPNFSKSCGWGHGQLSKKDSLRIAKEHEKLFEAINNHQRKTDSLNELTVLNEFSWPIKKTKKSGQITSLFGEMRFYTDKKGFYYHRGIDIGAPLNTKIYAIADGEVIYIGRNYFIEGNLTVIDHGANIIAFYMHQSKILVKNGQKVKQGEVIGLVGSTGQSTGPHLHLGVRVNNQIVNPIQIINLFSVNSDSIQK
jgi:hypothetical protein